MDKTCNCAICGKSIQITNILYEELNRLNQSVTCPSCHNSEKNKKLLPIIRYRKNNTIAILEDPVTKRFYNPNTKKWVTEISYSKSKGYAKVSNRIVKEDAFVKRIIRKASKRKRFKKFVDFKSTLYQDKIDSLFSDLKDYEKEDMELLLKYIIQGIYGNFKAKDVIDTGEIKVYTTVENLRAFGGTNFDNMLQRLVDLDFIDIEQGYIRYALNKFQRIVHPNMKIFDTLKYKEDRILYRKTYNRMITYYKRRWDDLNAEEKYQAEIISNLKFKCPKKVFISKMREHYNNKMKRKIEWEDYLYYLENLYSFYSQWHKLEKWDKLVYTKNDTFGRRTYHLLTNCPEPIRWYWTLNGQYPTKEIDVVNAQPLFLAMILKGIEREDLDFKHDVENGIIYEKIGKGERNKGKGIMIKGLFAKPFQEEHKIISSVYTKLGKELNMLKRVNFYESIKPKERYKNVAKMLQTHETYIMRKIRRYSKMKGRKYVSIHDGILQWEREENKDENILERFISKEGIKGKVKVKRNNLTLMLSLKVGEHGNSNNGGNRHHDRRRIQGIRRYLRRIQRGYSFNSLQSRRKSIAYSIIKGEMDLQEEKIQARSRRTRQSISKNKAKKRRINTKKYAGGFKRKRIRIITA